MDLFNKKTIARALDGAPLDDPDRQAILKQWADTIASGEIETQKETALHGSFKQKILIDVLGYRDFNADGVWTVAAETQIGPGAVDLALGRFSCDQRQIIAPFELKGARTRNLDAIMPGRAKSPVDQAWGYATGNAGSQWVLVSNYVEIRLYSYREGRQTYEVFDLKRLYLSEEYRRFQLLLSAENLLGGRTLELLEESRRENRDITERLYADYKRLRSELIDQVRLERPDMAPLTAIRVAQTILDRILFIAFAEDTNLLPRKILEQAFQSNNAFHPVSIWQNFLGLFKAIDEGSPALKIPRYNGGLFTPDAAIDSLAMPDSICKSFKALAEYDFASEVSVTVLGHIFEQSIADVEQLQAEARGESIKAKKTSGASGRRKRDGVVYTPDYIARFIVEQTLGVHAQEIFARLLTEHAAKGASAADEQIKWKSRAAEVKAWDAYRAALSGLRIVDPACGSGVFLVMAFDWLKAELSRVNEKLAELTGVGALLDPDSEILTHNLFGVDVNEESVEIAKLSLWVKTARHGKVLDSLDDNFRVGDSLIEDSSYAYRTHGFEWRSAFAAIFAEGGFDIVLGNPPYVRMEHLKAMKPWLQKRFEVVSDRADLYAYFFERGLKLLKPGGRMGYISSSTFFKTGSGAPLRSYLRSNATLETIVDFGDHQIFAGVTTYPAILTMQAGAPPEDHLLRFWAVQDMPGDNFGKIFAEQAQTYPQSALGSGSWELEDSCLRKLRDKIKAGKPTLKQVYGSPLYGIKTGLNEAFVIDTPTKERLCRQDPRSAELLKPFLEGKDLKRWRAEPRGLWIIYIPIGSVKIDDFPAIRAWLEQSKVDLTARAANQNWFELQQAQERYTKKFVKTKICYPHFSSKPNFLMDRSGYFLNNKSFGLECDQYHILSLFNSNVIWFYFSSRTTSVRGGFYEATSQHIETLPIPHFTDTQRDNLAALGKAAQAAAEKRYGLQQSLTHRIPDLARPEGPSKLTERLKTWWDLPDFAAFQAEIKKAFKTEIPLRQRNEWEAWIKEVRSQIHALTAEITRIEREINSCVYALFDLTPDEITLLEANI